MPSEKRYVNPRTGEVVDNPAIRPFRDILIELGEGSTHSELSDAFWELLQRVQDTGKAGTLTLQISISPNGSGRIDVKDEVKVKLPEFNRPQTAFFVDNSGNASRRDPNQPSLPGVTSIRKA
jgi:hypothetical protein